MIDLRDVLDALDLAIGRADGVLPSDTVTEFAETARRIRTRSGFLGESLVVALAGGTGSGKSSIVNAVVGEEVVETGVIRPTTQWASVIHRSGGSADLEALFDAIGVERRIAHDGAGPLVLIDLPDFDSTAEAHRHVVEEVLPRVDAAVWVLDPEKYADPVLHDDFLTPMAGHGDQFIFVLNQADRLGTGLGEALDSLDRRLRVDGFVDPAIVPAVAAPFEEADIGAFVVELEHRWDVKSTALAKLGIDVRSIANRGWREASAVHPGARGDVARDRIALCRATFVSLGVTAFEFHHRYTTERS